MLAHLVLDIAVHDMSTDEPHGARVMGPEAIARSKESRGKVGADGCRQGPASGPCQQIRERAAEAVTNERAGAESGKAE